MPSQNFPRPLNQQLDKISDPIPTNDVLADALLVTETTYFKGSGSSYTGTVPSNNFKYGVFCVVKRNDTSFIVHATSADGTSSNYYDGSAWGGWTPSTNELNAHLTPILITSDITFEDFVTNTTGTRFYKIGRICILQIDVTIGPLTAQTVKVIGSFSVDDYKPAAVSCYSDVYINETSEASGVLMGRGAVSTTGNIGIASNSARTNARVRGTFVWVSKA